MTNKFYKNIKEASSDCWPLPPVPLLSVLCVVLISILCPLLSSLAAFGLCTWMGNPLYTIMCVTPFLIAGVGVDDAFIMLQSWQHHRTIECPRRRLSCVMVHVGPSITITSLTNTIAFGIGFFTPTPQMSLFCLCTSIAVFIDYLLTFTLLCPVLHQLAQRSVRRVFPRPCVCQSSTEYLKCLGVCRVQCDGLSVGGPSRELGRPTDSALAPTLRAVRPPCRPFLALDGLRTAPAVPSVLLPIWSFFVDQLGNPPIIKTETAPDGSLNVVAFQFTIVTRHMTEWWNRAVVEEKVRAILERFPQFNATLHDGDAAILNMLLTVKSDLIGSIAVTIVSMAVICSLFIYSRLGVCAIALCISSICFTLVGVLSWCGADLDPVTMVDVLLATGFSVDYTAHVAHQYHTKKGTSIDRIAHSLHEMCPPMLQAGISTALCMLPLAFVPTYAIVAFAKTIFAVILIGLLHGLFLLPVFLCALHKDKRKRKTHGGELNAEKGEEEEEEQLRKDDMLEEDGEKGERRVGEEGGGGTTDAKNGG
uniref:SSD domain-containing protein n=1 Tax=Globodera pallida TaxID=36090 RepID=A0A183BIQ4_GLOPA